MKKLDKVAILGVGLIGSSIGLAIKERRLAGHCIGIGRRSSSLQQAKKRGAIDSSTLSIEKGVAQADIVIVCTPVASIVPSVEAVAKFCKPDCLITDAGSTKGAIVAALKKSLPPKTRFIGSHPLAGSEKSGAKYAQADLFAGRVVVVTPERKADSTKVAAISEFWQALGAVVLSMSPSEHDKGVAMTSHLPHFVAAALAEATPQKYAPLIGTGWSDTTRVAAGDADLWQQIFLDNSENLLRALDRTERTIARFRKALADQDKKRLKTLLQKAKQSRDALGS